MSNGEESVRTPSLPPFVGSLACKYAHLIEESYEGSNPAVVMYLTDMMREALAAMSEIGDSIGAAWLADNLTYMKEPLVNARTGEEIKGEARWTVWWNGPDAATFREALAKRGK
ncbi:MAG TPA: hypothetical protein VFA81_10800 [Burkholderiales bacterium]|nr:hypothetical protein [Burkholderiales bacterium]